MRKDKIILPDFYTEAEKEHYTRFILEINKRQITTAEAAQIERMLITACNNLASLAITKAKESGKIDEKIIREAEALEELTIDSQEEKKDIAFSTLAEIAPTYGYFVDPLKKYKKENGKK